MTTTINIKKLILLVLLLSGLTISFSFPAQALWLSGYEYRKQITINGSSTDDLTNYQMLLNVYKGSGSDSGNTVYLNDHVQNDFSDVRFTTADGTTELDYFIKEKTDGNDAKVWIEFDSLLQSSSTDFYMYYNNPTAASASNADDTMWLYEDFDDLSTGDLNGQDGWSAGGSGSSSVTVVTSPYVSAPQSLQLRRVAGSGGASANKAGSETTRTLVAEGKMRALESHTDTWHRYFRLDGNAGNILLLDMFVGGTWRYHNGSSWVHLGTTWSPGVWYTVKAVTKSTGVLDIYINNVLRASNVAFRTSPSTNEVEKVTFSFDNSGVDNTTTTHYDNIIVRKYVSAEPTWQSWGEEEQGVIPEPASLLLLGFGVTGLVLFRIKRG